MARDVMLLMVTNPFREPLEGVGPEDRDFFGVAFVQGFVQNNLEINSYTGCISPTNMA
jgi:hypothetical protein